MKDKNAHASDAFSTTMTIVLPVAEWFVERELAHEYGLVVILLLFPVL